MNSSKKAKAYGLFSIILTLVLGFTNCSDVHLVSVINTAKSASTLFGLLEEPREVRAHTRIVLLIDHSYSMVYGGCPTDLDGATPSLQPRPCQPPHGADYVERRYEVSSNWLYELRNGEDPDVKVLILPFSGGFLDENRKRLEPEALEFLELNDAIVRIQTLRDEQTRERLNPNLPLNLKRMGTSVPLPFLSLAKAKIQEEMIRLLRQRELHSTAFEFYFISDGFYKPVRENIETALNLANCPVECVMDPELVSCDNMVDATHIVRTSNPKVKQTLSSEQQNQLNVCKANPRACTCLTYGNKLYEYFGRYEDTDPRRVETQLLTISELANYFGEGSLRMNFVRVIDPQGAAPVGLVDVFTRYKELIKDSTLVNLREMDASAPPPAPSLSQISFKIDNFYALNLNATLNSENKWVPDSDADGLSDEAEIALGSDPGNPRSGLDDEGVCLDGLRYLYGCRTVGCDRLMDRDGDGLNECEELTLGAGINRRDTSGDGIFDYHKILKGLGPLLDTTTVDSNSDSVMDETAFKFGLTAGADARLIPATQRIDSRVDFLGFKKNGAGVGTPAYRISVTGIPLVNTAAVGPVDELYYDRLHLDPVAADESVGHQEHRAGSNQVIFLVRVRGMENKDLAYWLLWRGEIDYRAGNSITLDLSQFKELRKTGWGL